MSAAPPVPGADLVEPARTVDAAERFNTEIGLEPPGAHAVVIGSGYIGLEMAEALVKRGLRVTMLDRADQVMPVALDADMAMHVQDGAESDGMTVRLSMPLEEIEHDDKRRPRVVRAGGERIEADHVVLAAGVRPANQLAKDAGLPLGDFGGLLTDDHQRV